VRRGLLRLFGGGVYLACVLSLSSTAAWAQTFDRGPWQSDYAALKQALEQRYSNLAWFASPESGVDLPALDRRTLAALRAAASDDDARSALLDFVRGFHDGHFSQLTTPEPAGATRTPAPGNREYSRQDPAGGCAGLDYAPGDRPAFSLPFEGLPGFHLISDGIGTPFRAGTQVGGDPIQRVGIVRIPSFEETSDIGLCERAWTRNDVWNAQGKLLRGKLSDAVEESWYGALADVLRTFKKEGVAAVLVDVGNNSGGDDSGDIAARLFTAKPLHSASLWMSQDSAASSPYFDEQLDALHAAQRLDSSSQAIEKALATFVRQKDHLLRGACPMDWVWRSRQSWNGTGCRRLVEAGSAGGPLAYVAPDSARDARTAPSLHWPTTILPLWGTWDGPLYVLTDHRTYSAAEMFVAVLKNNGAAKTVGTVTGGDGCGFMNDPEPVILPHSRLRFRVPNCVRMRADGTDEVAGIKPDIPVMPTEGENSRRRAWRVFNEVLSDLKRSSAERPTRRMVNLAQCQPQ
jgi:hypothetical protein